MVRREAYRKSGGHAQIRTTMHDGLMLPQLFRRHGLRTDIADLTHLATCRMYHSASDVWRGLSKNATEGMAAPARILPFTVLLFCGQILPLLLLIAPASYSERERSFILVALAASFLPRLFSVWKYRQPLASALLHPLGVALLLVLQWYALVGKLAGPSGHMERACISHGLMQPFQPGKHFNCHGPVLSLPPSSLFR